MRDDVQVKIGAKDTGKKVRQDISRGVKGIASAAGLAGGAVGIALAAGKGIKMADEYQVLSTRIRTATKDTGDYEKVFAQLRATAIGTGSDFETTVATFQSLSRIREDLGATNDQMIALTQTTQQLGVIGGSSSEAMKNGMLQFNQAMAAGIFRAEEFNSIVENVPELAKRIGDGFGKTAGELRKMVLDGKLFSKDVANVLLKAAPEIADEFGNIPISLDRAFVSLKTSVGLAILKLDEASGITGSMAAGINALALELRLLSGDASAIERVTEKLEGMRETAADIQEAISDGDLSFWEKSTLGLQNIDAAKKALARLNQQIEISETSLENLKNSGDVGTIGGTGSAPEATDSEKSAEASRAAKLASFERFAQALKVKRLEAFDEDRLAQQASYDQELIDLDAKFEALDIKEGERAELEGSHKQAQRDLHLAHQAKISEIDRLAYEEGLALDAEQLALKIENEEIAREDEIARLLGFNDRKHQAEQMAIKRHEDEKLKIQFESAGKYSKLLVATSKLAKVQNVKNTKETLGALTDLTAGVANSSKTMFNINKAAALANAVVNTAQGVTSALADVPYPANLAAAAMVAAAGAAEIAAISSTSFGSGSGSSSFGGGTGIPSEATSTPNQSASDFFGDGADADDQDDLRGGREITVVLKGGDDAGSALIGMLRTEIEDNDEILIPEGSRQAAELGGSV